jgi:hypothetical protein
MWDGYKREPEDTPEVTVCLTMREIGLIFAHIPSRVVTWNTYAVPDVLHDKLGDAKRRLENRENDLNRLRSESRKNSQNNR